MKLRRDIEEPRCKKSKTDRDEPRRGIPYTESEEPILIKLRRERDEPK
jgi:hypothetical protein